MRSMISMYATKSTFSPPYKEIWNYSETSGAMPIINTGLPISAPRMTPFGTTSIRRLPLHPIPLGFIINSVFYGTFLWLPFMGFVVMKRRRRIKRGLCAQCGYDLTGVATCPECGSP